MSVNVGQIHYLLDLDTTRFDAATARIGKSMSAIGDKMVSAGKTMTMMFTLPILAGFGFAIKAASDLNETINKVDVSFKDQSKSVKDWSKNSIKSMGLAQQSALDAASMFGDMGTSMGLSTKAAAKMSMNLVQLGADMSSFKNIPIAESQTALAAIFTGETESLKRLGIVMTEVNLIEYAKTQGITKSIKEMTQQEKVQLRYNYIMSVTKNAQGDFIRTSDGAANQTRMFGERIKQLAADFGAKLMPAYMKLLEIGNKVLDWFNKMKPAQQKQVLMIAAIVAAIGPLLIAFGSIAKAIGILTPIILSPWGLVLLAVLAVVGGLVYLEVKFGAVSKAMKPFSNWINSNLIPTLQNIYKWFNKYILPTLQEFWTFVVTQLQMAWKDMKKGIDDISNALAPMIKKSDQWKIVLFVLMAPLILVAALVIGLTVAITVIVVAISRLVGWVYQVSGSFQKMSLTILKAMWNFNAAVFNGINSAIGWFRSLPGRVAGAIGNLGNLLWGIGASIIGGLLGGMRRAFEDVQNFVGGIAGWIRANKGPLSYDKQLLIPAGSAIMQGLNKGLMSGYLDVEKTIQNITGAIGNTSISGNITASGSMATIGNPNPIGNTSNTTANFTGPIYLQDKSAVDEFFGRLSRNSELASKGMATI